jgi:hypothetical protein
MDILFSRQEFRDYANDRLNEITNSIQKLSREDFKQSTVAEIADSYSVDNSFEQIALQEKDIYQKPPKDVDIQSHHGEVQGTGYTFVLPFTGDRYLLHIKPTTFGMNYPIGQVNGAEISFELNAIPGTDPNEVAATLNSNISLIKKWLGWLKTDIDHYQAGLKPYIIRELEKRKKKLDDDDSSASAIGIPIKF